MTGDTVHVADLRAVLTLRPEGLVWTAGRFAGRLAGFRHTGSRREVYWRVGVRGKRLLRSRIVFALAHGRWPTAELDHVNRNTEDDRPENLREATRAQNNQNRRAYRKASGLPRGVVSKPGGRFEAAIGVAGKRIQLGRYDTASEASAAYEAARCAHYGAFA